MESLWAFSAFISSHVICFLLLSIELDSLISRYAYAMITLSFAQLWWFAFFCRLTKVKFNILFIFFELIDEFHMDRALGQHWIHFHATINLWAFNTAVNIWFTNLITYAKKLMCMFATVFLDDDIMWCAKRIR